MSVTEKEVDKIISLKGFRCYESQVRDDLLIYTSIDKQYWKMPKDKIEWDKKYKVFLLTDRWQELKNACIEKNNGVCALCVKEAVVAHHRKYPTEYFGEETQECLTALCNGCHHKHHNPYAELDEVREIVDQEGKTKKGTKCPVCDQTVKLNETKLVDSMALFLMWLKSHSDDFGWVHVSSVASRATLTSRVYSKLKWWGLIESKPNKDDPTKKESGIWRLTKKGMAFVNNEIEVPRKIFRFKRQFHNFSKEQTNIIKALGDKFNYEEIRNPEFNWDEV